MQKTLNYTSGGTLYTVTTDYLDGFHYKRQNGITPQEPVEMRTPVAFQERAFLPVEEPQNLTLTASPQLEFFPTAEGFYDFANSKYIYQYKDHLGNMRVSFAKKANGVGLDLSDINDYYPFGMNHYKGETSAYFGLGGNYVNYKYNGKELQETGMYDYGARFYMPDIGRFSTQDPMQVFDMWQSSYVYANNNPILYQDEYGLGIFNVIGNFFQRAVSAIGSIFNSGCHCSGFSGESVADAWKRSDFPSDDRPRRGTPANKTAQNTNPTPPITPVTSNPAGVVLSDFSGDIPEINPSAMSMPNIGIADITPKPTRPPLPTGVEFNRDIPFVTGLRLIAKISKKD